MKKSKRLLAVLLALSMTATLAACSPGESDEPSTDPSISGNQPSNEETLPAGETGGASASEPSLDEKHGHPRYPAMFPQRSQAKNNRRKKKALRRKPMKTTRPKCRRPRLLIITTQRQTMRNQRRRVLQKHRIRRAWRKRRKSTMESWKALRIR